MTDATHNNTPDHKKQHDGLGNPIEPIGSVDSLGNRSRDNARDHSGPDDRRDPDFGYSGGSRNSTSNF